MPGLPWFELDTDFAENPKIRALASRLREPLADAYVARLYAYCYRQCIDRLEPDVAAETLEDAVRWKGRRGVLFDAWHAVGILEREAGKVVVHGVGERLAPHVASRVAAAERQRRRRQKVAKSPNMPSSVTPSVTRDVTGDVPVTSRPALSMSLSVSSPCESRASASDETSTEPSQSSPTQKGNGPDEEAQAVLRLLPAKAVDVATALGLPPGAVDVALEDFRRRGLVRLRGGLVPLWEPA